MIRKRPPLTEERKALSKNVTGAPPLKWYPKVFIFRGYVVGEFWLTDVCKKTWLVVIGITFAFFIIKTLILNFTLLHQVSSYFVQIQIYDTKPAFTLFLNQNKGPCEFFKYTKFLKI